MLSARHRMRDGCDFGRATRAHRAATATLVVHMVDKTTDQARPPRVGFVVSKAVGSAVIRNRVKRRLRHLMRSRLSDLPASSLVVVRARPACATAAWETLGVDLDRALAVVRGRMTAAVEAR